MDIADCLNQVYFLLGDFNIKYFHGNNLVKFNNTKWSNMIVKFGLEQLIKTPTRISKRSSTIIDHIYTNCSSNIKEAFISTLAISDHYPICLTYAINNKNTKKNKHNMIKYRSFKKFDEISFQTDLLNSGLEHVDMTNEPNEALNVFYDKLNYTLSQHAI